MAEIGFRMIANVDFDLLPIALVITYFFTPGANREQAFQGLDFSKCFLEFYDKLLTLFPHQLRLCDVSSNGRCANYRAGFIPDRRYCQRDIDVIAILPSAYGFIVKNTFTTTYSCKQIRYFMKMFGWYMQRWVVRLLLRQYSHK